MTRNHHETSKNRSYLSTILGYIKDPVAQPRNDAESASDSEYDQPPQRPECGGHNEAFIMQHWASYGPY